MNELVNFSEGGRHYGVTREGIRLIVERRKIKKTKRGGQVLVELNALDEYFSKSEGSVGSSEVLEEALAKEAEILHSFNFDELNQVSRNMLAASLLMRLGRLGYRHALRPVSQKLGVEESKVLEWYRSLFERTYGFGKLSIKTYPDTVAGGTLTSRDVSRLFDIGISHLWLGIEKAGLPARKINGDYEIELAHFPLYEDFYRQWKPVSVASRLMNVKEKILYERVRCGNIPNYRGRHTVLVNVNSTNSYRSKS